MLKMSESGNNNFNSNSAKPTRKFSSVLEKDGYSMEYLEVIRVRGNNGPEKKQRNNICQLNTSEGSI
jgi:hypothetical protein